MERVIQMEAPPPRRAWAWYDLGNVLRWLRAPQSEVVTAFQNALNILPAAQRFRRALEEARKGVRRR